MGSTLGPNSGPRAGVILYLRVRVLPKIQNPTQNVKMIFLSEFHHKTILTAFLLSNLGYKNNYICTKFFEICRI
jgi:hypothetical protein